MLFFLRNDIKKSSRWLADNIAMLFQRHRHVLLKTSPCFFSRNRFTLGIENVFSMQPLGVKNEKTTCLLPIYFEEITIFAL
jgi:hypothetical protein